MIEKSLTRFAKYLSLEKNYSEHTVRSYINDINQFAQFLFTHQGTSDILKAEHIHVRSWVVHLIQKKYSPKSVNRKLSSLKTFYKFQKKTGLISSNPASKLSGPKTSKRLPSVMRVKDIEKGLSSFESASSFAECRDRLLINILYHTGIRKSEVIGLKDRDVDIYQNQIKVLGKGNKERLIPISGGLISEIKVYLSRRDEEFDTCDFFFITDRGKKMYPKYVYNKISSWISLFSSIDKRSPHILRHSFATHLADGGAELNAIKELLGHSSLAATEIYTHNSIERLKGVYNKSHPRAVKKDN